MSSKIILSFFGNGYITKLDAEIKHIITHAQEITKQDILKVLCSKGYKKSVIIEELDRQCYTSTLRYIPETEVYEAVDTGILLWDDMLKRFPEQWNMLGGNIRLGKQDVTLTIYKTDFQNPAFKILLSHLDFKQAPVMRWTKKMQTF